MSATAVTVVFGFASLILMDWPLYVIYRQLNVMKTQDEILARRSNLAFTAEVLPSAQGRDASARRVKLLVSNTGSKSARDFYWHLTIPTSFSRANLDVGGGSLGPDETLQIEGREHHVFRELNRRPVYPGRRLVIGTLECDNPEARPPILIGWKISAEDGEFPIERGLQQGLEVRW